MRRLRRRQAGRTLPRQQAHRSQRLRVETSGFNNAETRLVGSQRELCPRPENTINTAAVITATRQDSLRAHDHLLLNLRGRSRVRCAGEKSACRYRSCRRKSLLVVRSILVHHRSIIPQIVPSRSAGLTGRRGTGVAATTGGARRGPRCARAPTQQREISAFPYLIPR